MNTKIIEQLEVSVIENEIVNCEEYSLELEIRLCKLREFESRENSSKPERNNSSTSDTQQAVIIPDVSKNSTSSVISSDSSLHITADFQKFLYLHLAEIFSVATILGFI